MLTLMFGSINFFVVIPRFGCNGENNNNMICINNSMSLENLFWFKPIESKSFVWKHLR